MRLLALISVSCGFGFRWWLSVLVFWFSCLGWCSILLGVFLRFPGVCDCGFWFPVFSVSCAVFGGAILCGFGGGICIFDFI